MQKKLALKVLIVSMLLTSCYFNTINLKNGRKGKMIAKVGLKMNSERKYQLDSITAPKPQYLQIVENKDKSFDITFLNKYIGAIYVYDYETASLKKVIRLEKEGMNGIKSPLGYYIKSYDSIYVYNKVNNELVLIGQDSKVKARISLINNIPFRKAEWTYYYPQYFPTTVAPIYEINHELIFPGQYMLSLPDSIAQRFHFETHIDEISNKVSFKMKYPVELYGNNIFWENEGLFTNVYSDLGSENKMVYSFPVSHDIYIADSNSDAPYTTKYFGSNEAGTIASIKKKLTREEILLKACETDLYCALRYDKYREIYYRFIRRAIHNATNISTLRDKEIGIIIYDKKFNYLGETTIGTGKQFNWENSFVTKDGLNIEFIDSKDESEKYLNFKIFMPVKI